VSGCSAVLVPPRSRFLLEAITIEAALAMTAPSLAAEYVEEIGE